MPSFQRQSLSAERCDPTRSLDPVQQSYVDYRAQMDCARRAASYPSDYNGSFRQQREKRCLQRLIAAIPPRSTVLDLPCGTGRVTRLIAEAGHRVIAGDSSPHMVAASREHLLPWFPDLSATVMDAMDTGLPDRSVDAVICNRLLHHFSDAGLRIGVLTELARVSRGLVIVSFSCSFGLDVAWQKFTRRLQGRALRHYQPISLRQFRQEFTVAGLHPIACSSVLWGLSRMRYFVGLPNRQADEAPDSAIHRHGAWTASARGQHFAA